MAQEMATDLVDQSLGWLADFEAAMSNQDSGLLRGLFLHDSYWRDMVSFTWDLRQVYGIDKIETELFSVVETVRPANLALDKDRPLPLVSSVTGADIVEVFFTFETAAGYGKGFLNLIPDDSSSWNMRARLLNTVLYSLRGIPNTSPTRHPEQGYEQESRGQTWRDNHHVRTGYVDRDPEVLVVGGGQAGVCIAARLDQLGVDTLVVERNDRAGDNWRNRYDNLALHTPTDMSDFPFLPFPRTFPNYLSKDTYGDYIESYVKMLDLNFWTSTEFVSGEFDEAADAWLVTLRTADGTNRTLRPKHLILTLGSEGGKAHIPDLPGLTTFHGAVMHSSAFTSGKDFAGKKAMVVGMGNSGHDVAFDMSNNGAAVTMVQRSSTSVVSREMANLAYGLYWMGDVPQDEADQRFSASYVYPLLVEALQGYTAMIAEADAELLTGLEKAGVRLDQGPDETGWLMKFIRHGGGYYLNVGCSDAIIRGDIKVEQLDSIDRFVPEGVRMTDGSSVELDVVVLATGFENMQSHVRNLLGDEISAKVGEIAGIGDDGEIRNLCKPTGQQNLWFLFGGIADARKASAWLALQVKARLEGIAPPLVRQKDGSLKAVYHEPALVEAQ
ncbi:MAG: Flavin-containing monooxygenase [Nocardioidaceae bacterium]|nr:Flavin-containing monooxygenase [Nocardioidaceae bacterium]